MKSLIIVILLNTRGWEGIKELVAIATDERNPYEHYRKGTQL